MTLDQIEYDVARGAMKAPDCFTQMLQHVRALEKRNEELEARVTSDHCVVPRSLVVDVMAYGEDGKVLEPWMVDKLESALLGAFPSPPLEQGRKEPNGRVCEYCNEVHKDSRVACPEMNRAREQIAAEPKCKTCNGAGQLQEFSGGECTLNMPCLECEGTGACHEVATPGTDAGEKQ